ncbi:ABC transporter ATP-binding protein [Mycobacterium sp. 852002-40037_SCH5390672]|uniref:ABC transporter ATP-binding protein n=1 Tax=Mycobacterium sp. 852002-40037_SCH5390672 TaxID=1834089 RepID=UPI000804F571|nr:ABC transporter ATP-binding protein [Mycobacterium sp. 852002-40037_SCH5390672]OBB95803.1 ABC transporter ATP-binding protein [Mycobacterium sp. 852002-40037_SCH5390672]
MESDGGSVLVRLSGIGRKYEVGATQVHALDGIDLDLRAGEIVAVTGSSGAGKSSLLHLLGALDRPTSGSVCINGTDVTTASERRLADFRLRNVGFVFQAFNLVPTLSAWENVALPHLFGGERMSHARAGAVALLDKVGLGDRIDHRPSQLSGGQMQRVAIARALSMHPPIVLADEPTGNLDSKSSEEIMNLLCGLVDSGETSLVVVVTHDVGLANSYASRIISMRDGKIESDKVQASVT